MLLYIWLCHSGDTDVTQWWHGGVTVVTQWWHSGDKVVTETWHRGYTESTNGDTEVKQMCETEVTQG